MANILQIQMFPYDTHSDLCEKIVNALKADGHNVSVLFLKGSYNEEFPSNADSINTFGFSSGSLKGIRRWFSIYKIFKFCKSGEYDVIIGHRFKPIHILLSISAFLNSRMIGIIHGEGDYNRGYRRRLIRRKSKLIANFVAVSSSVQEHLFSLNCGFERSNTTCINNAVDVADIKAGMMTREIALAELGIKKDRFLFGAIGRLVPIKGHRHLLGAFGELSRTNPEIELVIIGGGRERERLEKQIETLQIQNRVHLVGWRDDPTKYLSALDCYVFPSLSEGLPLGLLEGMCAEIPVIGSDIPSIRPILTGCGKLVEPESTQSLKIAMDEIISLSEEQRKSMGENCFREVRENYNLDVFERKYQGLIKEIL